MAAAASPATACHNPLSAFTLVVFTAALLAALMASPRSQTLAHPLPAPLLLPLTDRGADRALRLFLTAALAPDSLDNVHHLSSQEEDDEEEDGEREVKVQRRQLSPLSLLTAMKRRGGWKKIPIEPRFAPFGSKLILTRGRQESRGPSILRYGRSV